jgi:hypothetical protein
MKYRTLAVVGAFVVAFVSVSANPALAQGRGQDKRAQPAKQAKQAKQAKPAKPVNREAARPVFGSRDREVIADYYGRRSGLPPGLAKRQGDLPPGLEKQLQRNGTLPPGLQKKLRPLPRDLERRLDPLPRGFRRGLLDRHLIVYRDGTYEIGDTLFDVVR